MSINLSNNYQALGNSFSEQILPIPVAKPSLLLWNETLAKALAIPFRQDNDAELIAQYFSGNQLIEGSKPVAQAYSGHQFGNFNPQLGDGRAHLLGDIADTQGKRWDIQLKGSGASSFSRRGDGRCALGPALREYIMSEAMFALGVPTTRCLAVVTTGENVYRERPYEGAVVTRVAASHIRVGTFQYFAARGETDSLKKLTNYAINRHFPELLVEEKIAPTLDPDEKTVTNEISGEQVLKFFAAVLSKQIPLVLSWLRVGFIHGVMNTDNATISGETIDYGPCAMMNAYDVDTVFSSIDHDSRYAFGKQAGIMQWNMTRLAETLLALVDSDEDNAVAKIQPLLKQFHQDLEQGYLTMMAAKIGIADAKQEDGQLINDLLAIMQKKKLDYTQTFAALTATLTISSTDLASKSQVEESLMGVLNEWLPRWSARIEPFKAAAQALMVRSNPIVIPRNHDVEALLDACQESGDLTALHKFLAVLRQPYTETADTKHYQDAPVDGDKSYYTYCGT